MVALRCPTCGKQFDSESSPALPFCCQRCRLIDLGRWLNEERGLPVVDEEDDDQEDQTA
ncbi:MAG: DNA gyrase inhibitor YacG [Planctomycetes bacterium]|nr:DNA gyrase inhibitor YacG [Planctomycetota bacterium]